jgi:hypothetical protein
MIQGPYLEELQKEALLHVNNQMYSDTSVSEAGEETIVAPIEEESKASDASAAPMNFQCEVNVCFLFRRSILPKRKLLNHPVHNLLQWHLVSLLETMKNSVISLSANIAGLEVDPTFLEAMPDEISAEVFTNYLLSNQLSTLNITR